MKKDIKYELRKYFQKQKELFGIDGYLLEDIKEISSNQHSSFNHLLDDSIKSDKDSKKIYFEEIAKEIKSCRKCNLGLTRLNAVVGEGNIDAQIMFIGEGPGYQEDHTGRPFVGQAGMLLTRIIEALKFKRSEVFIANIVKCHPMKIPNPELRDNDRPPTLDEIAACLPFLERQIDIITPKVICCLGAVSSKVITGYDLPIGELRGRVFNYSKNENIKIVPTYHPAALLRNPNLKKILWQDMQIILKIIS